MSQSEGRGGFPFPLEVRSALTKLGTFRCVSSPPTLLLPLFHGKCVKLVSVVDEKNAVRGHGSGVDRASHIHFSQDLLFFTVLEHNDIPVLIGEIDLSVSNERRTPDRGEHIMNPEFLARIGVNTVEETAEVRDVDDIV